VNVKLLLLATLLLATAGCSYANEGTVEVLEYYGKIDSVKRPDDGTFTALGPGWDTHTVSLRSVTATVQAKVTSRDNAAIVVPVSITYHVDEANVPAHVRKFGFEASERNTRLQPILEGQVQTETRNAFAEHGAYEVYANQETIQSRISTALKPLLAEQTFLVVESVQLGSPDFLDDRIEQAAGAVVANEKQKQSEEAALAAARVAAERKQVEAATFRDPALLQIKLLELQLQIEQARSQGIAGHQGPLTIVNGSLPNMQLQVPTSK
jgi:hypothetical protein